MAKIAIIGAGGMEFTRKLIRDILSVPELAETRFALTDINKHNLDKAFALVMREIRHNGISAEFETTLDRRQALTDADYVLNVTRIGGIEAYAHDIEIPLKYGVDQCVGDTLCIGGLMYAQRNIPVILDFCKDMREVSRPGALFMNYANPMAMNTWAATMYGDVNAVGLCHGIQHGIAQLVDVVSLLVNGKRQPGSKGYREVRKDDMDIVCSGINHQTWFTRVMWDGQDWTGRLLEGFEKHPRLSQQEKVRIDVLRRFGYYSTESNGHLSEYFAWYRKRPGEVKHWVSMDAWILGETGGYLRHTRNQHDWFKTEYPKLLQAEPQTYSPACRSVEHGGYIVEAMETNRIYRGYFNRPNNGIIKNLPDDAIIESSGYVDRLGIHMAPVEDLPQGCAAICNQSISVQRLGMEAAVHGDVDLLKQAAMLDPLTGAVCNPAEISQMVDAMLVAQAKWLPQYRKALPAARRRMKNEKPLGTRKSRGGARATKAQAAALRREHR